MPDDKSASHFRRLVIDKQARSIPSGAELDSFEASGCLRLATLPEDLRARRIDLSGCTGLRQLPAGLSCVELDLRNTRLRQLPGDLRVTYRLDLQDNLELEALPEGLETGTLILAGCTALRALPERLKVCYLDISGCTRLDSWPVQGHIRHGRLNMRGCSRLVTLPDWLQDIAQLDVSGCTQLSELREGLRVSSWLDLADTKIKSLPRSLQGVRLRWRGVWIEERIAFQPESITVAEVLAEQNAELRRVLLERYGFARFMQNAQAQVLDQDRDRGGQRRLLRIKLTNDEDLVCVSMFCPSTGRQYITRVPPDMTTCLQAVAWIAGFDAPDHYKPLVES